MRILQLVNRVPHPINDGGNLAVRFYLEGFLEAGVSLSLLAMNTTRHWVSVADLPDCFQALTFFKTVKVDNRIRPLPAICNLLSRQSYHVSRFISKDYRKALQELLQQQEFDVIQLEGLYLMPYVPLIRSLSSAKVVLRQHNAEYLIWKRLAEAETNPLRKWYLNLLTHRLQQFEKASLNQVDLILAISNKDAETFKKMGATSPIYVQSFGLELTGSAPMTPTKDVRFNLYHLGAMDWRPNQEAMLYFIRKVFPIVRRQFPQVNFHLAGRKMPRFFLQSNWPQVKVYGEVADAQTFEKDKSILVVPLRAGGGVRIKILRAMAAGKAIVSTSVGAEGLGLKHGKEALIADDPVEMAREIIELLMEPKKIAELGRQARSFILQKHHPQKMIREIMAYYEELITGFGEEERDR